MAAQGNFWNGIEFFPYSELVDYYVIEIGLTGDYLFWDRILDYFGPEDFARSPTCTPSTSPASSPGSIFSTLSNSSSNSWRDTQLSSRPIPRRLASAPVRFIATLTDDKMRRLLWVPRRHIDFMVMFSQMRALAKVASARQWYYSQFILVMDELRWGPYPWEFMELRMRVNTIPDP